MTKKQALYNENKKLAERFEKDLRSTVSSVSEQTIKGCLELAKITVNQALKITYPNKGEDGFNPRTKKTDAIQELKNRIKQDVIGKGEGTEPPLVTAVKYGESWGLPDDFKEAKGENPKRIYVPARSLTKKKGEQPPIIRNAKDFVQHYKQITNFKRGKKTVYRARKDNKEPIWVGRGVISGAIKLLQKDVGKLLSGWSKASAMTNKGRAVGGSFPELGGDGNFYVKKGLWRASYILENNEARKYLSFPNKEFNGDRIANMALKAFAKQKKIITEAMEKKLEKELNGK